MICHCRLVACLFAFFAALAAGLRLEGLSLNEESSLYRRIFPAVCDDNIVRETCQLLFGFGNTSVKDYVTVSEVQMTLSAAHTAVKELYDELDLCPNGQHYCNVKCEDLCNGVAEFFRDLAELPPASDVACYEGADGRSVCDVDLRPHMLASLVNPGRDIPDYKEPKRRTRTGRVVSPRTFNSTGNATNVPARGPRQQVNRRGLRGHVLVGAIEYTPKELAQRVANMFRIYPNQATDVVSAGGRSSGRSEAKEVEQGEPMAVEDLCTGRKKNECPTGVCKWEYRGKWQTACVRNTGVDAVTCAGLQKGLCQQTPGCGWVWNGQKSTSCIQTFGPSNCKGLDKHHCELREGICEWAWSGSRSDACVDFTQTTTTTDWVPEVSKRNLQAQAYVSTAIRKWRRHESKNLMELWFGKFSASNMDTHREVGRVLNSVAKILNNVDYIYPGDACEEDTFAYVYQDGEGSMSDDGKYIFNICDLYMKSEDSIQIETLTHESSHHAAAYTSDVCFEKDAQYVAKPKEDFEVGTHPGDTYDLSVASTDNIIVNADKGRTIHPSSGKVEGQVALMTESTYVFMLDPPEECKETAYGRSTCKKLAKKDPLRAVRNADNFCYYIQDLTDKE